MPYKILIVEDDINLSEMYKIKFQKEWFEVQVSDNWFDALVTIQNFKPDVILLDIMMPDIDWFETLKVIREQTSFDTKIIMFSNLNRKDDIDKALNLWADDYLIKANVTPKEAVERVKDMLWAEKEKKSSNQSDVKLWIEVVCPHCWKKFIHKQ